MCAACGQRRFGQGPEAKRFRNGTARVLKEYELIPERENGVKNRAVKIVKHMGSVPCVAACTAGGREFKVPLRALARGSRTLKPTLKSSHPTQLPDGRARPGLIGKSQLETFRSAGR